MRGLADAALMLGAAILGIAALVHFYWAAVRCTTTGGAGMALAVPERDGKPLFQPSRAATVAAGLLIGAIGLFYGALAAGLLPGRLPASPVMAAVAMVGLVFLARAIGDFDHVGFFNRGGASGFAKADRLFYSPLCLFLGASGILAAVSHLP